jgi:hypothetical protein
MEKKNAAYYAILVLVIAGLIIAGRMGYLSLKEVILMVAFYWIGRGMQV